MSKKTAYKRNYGVLTDVSKGLNYAVGDRGGRTISLRTAHGIKNTFNVSDMDDETAEDIAHGAMIAAGGLLSSKNDGAKATGLFLALALLVCYQNGK